MKFVVLCYGTVAREEAGNGKIYQSVTCQTNSWGAGVSIQEMRGFRRSIFLLLNLCYFILRFKTQCQINISLTVWRQSELNLFFFFLYQNWFFDHFERFSQNCPSFSRAIPFNLLPLKLSLFILSLRSLLSRFFTEEEECRETFNYKKLVCHIS